MTTYLTSCPKCGGQLAPVALDPQTAPWLCASCGLGFFAAELSPAARSAYRPQFRDHGTSAHAIHLARDAELAEAHARGTSARDDQIGILDDGQLAFVASRVNVHPAVKSAVAQAQKQRGH